MKKIERNQVLPVLRKAAWLAEYPTELAERLLAEGDLVHLNAGEWAQAEGDNRNGLSVVIDGLLHTYCTAPGDRNVMIWSAEPGSVLGHATRHGGGPRLVTAVCAEPSILLEISESALDRVAVNSPEIWRAIAAFTYEDLRNALRMAAEVIALRPRERIAARLLAICENGPFEAFPVLKISQELRGEKMGVTRNTVNFHLSTFQQDGLITIGYGRIKLNDLGGLRAIANG